MSTEKTPLTFSRIKKKASKISKGDIKCLNLFIHDIFFCFLGIKSYIISWD